MKKINLAYLAGVLDSDGSFSIAVDTWRVRNLGGNPSFQEIIAIGQCDQQALDLAYELFGGGRRSQKPRGPNRRTMFYWQVTNKKAIAVVRALLPFLRIKRRQAEVLLKLRTIKDRGRKANTQCTAPRIRRTRPEVIKEMNALAVKVRQLNDSRFPLPLSK